VTSTIILRDCRATHNGGNSILAGPGKSGLLVQELIGEGNQVVARLRATGKHTGAHPRMPKPTGRDFDVEQIWIFTLSDGLITEIRAVSDRLGMFLQLGWDWPTVI
jgi:predicted ester cyclase